MQTRIMNHLGEDRFLCFIDRSKKNAEVGLEYQDNGLYIPTELFHHLSSRKAFYIAPNYASKVVPK